MLLLNWKTIILEVCRVCFTLIDVGKREDMTLLRPATRRPGLPAKFLFNLDPLTGVGSETLPAGRASLHRAVE